MTNADFADCNGDYLFTEDLRVSWAPDRPVYINTDKDRVIFWNTGGLGWSIGKSDYLESGNHWHRSGLDTVEPWQGEWQGGAVVRCGRAPRDGNGGDTCSYGGWSDWSRCSVTCGVGHQIRVRRNRNQVRGCTKLQDKRPCQAAPCPVDCQWGGWGGWSSCSRSCGPGQQTRTRDVSVRAVSGGECDLSDGRDSRTCAVAECVARDCCPLVSVSSTGGARRDQALYMGTYTRLEREYNGRPAYKKMDGHDPLYVYYFTSQRDGISLWVIGPELGEFIAGIRNSSPAPVPMTSDWAGPMPVETGCGMTVTGVWC